MISFEKSAALGFSFFSVIRKGPETSLLVPWLRRHVSNAGGTGSIPGQGTKIPHADVAWSKGKEKVLFLSLSHRHCWSPTTTDAVSSSHSLAGAGPILPVFSSLFSAAPRHLFSRSCALPCSELFVSAGLL